MTRTMTIISASNTTPPLFLRLRCSSFFLTFTVAAGISIDLLGYGIIVPVLPFKLAELGYDDIAWRCGLLVSTYALGLLLSTPFIAYAGLKCRGRQFPLLVSLLFMSAALVLFMTTQNFYLMLVARFLQGISGTGIWTFGLALIIDSVPSEKIGRTMAWVVVGEAIGNCAGAPVGGALYASLGYQSIFIFVLIFVFFNLVFRLMIIEKHTALQYIEAGIEIPGFEAPNYISSVTSSSDKPFSCFPSKSDLSATTTQPVSSSDSTIKLQSLSSPESIEIEASFWTGMKSMLTNPRALSLFALTVLNGSVMGGLVDTALSIWLDFNWGLDSRSVGLVFLAVYIPSFVASPLAGWACDKYGAKYIAVFGVISSVLAYALLIIKGALPLFIFFLVVMGSSIGFFLTPTLADLSVVVESTSGLGAIVVYCTFNFCSSLGQFMGPLFVGQFIDRLEIEKGWVALCIMFSSVAFILVPFIVIYVGGPIKRRNGEKDVLSIEV